jgi:hypothetical protein
MSKEIGASMSRRPNRPCADCGKLIWSGGNNLPTGLARCRECFNLAHPPIPKPYIPKDKIDIVCDVCGKVFQGPKHAKRCPGECQKIGQREAMRRCNNVYYGIESITKICPECGQEFEYIPNPGPPRKYCSDKCSKRVEHRMRRHKERISGKRGANKQLRFQRISDQTPKDNIFTNRELAERDRWICHLCGGVIDPNAPMNSDYSLNRDHIIPISMGGSDIIDNCKASHMICNAYRGNMSVEEWFSVQTTEIVFMRITS